MQPSANIPYDAEAAWVREDQDRTEKILLGLSKRFLEHAAFHVERIAGEAYVQLAKEGRQFAPQTVPETPMKSATRDQFDGDSHEPVVFISYSRDSDAHNQWVLDLASKLQKEGGVRIILDRWHLAPGGDCSLLFQLYW